MKVVIEKYVCDACNAEMEHGKHYTIVLGDSSDFTGNSFTDSERVVKKDLCCDCYRAIMSLIDMKKTDEKSFHNNKSIDGRKHKYDKDIVKELWAKGLTYEQIMAKTGLKKHQVCYVICKMSMEEREALREKYSIKPNHIENNNKGVLRVTTDEYGLVTSITEID